MTILIGAEEVLTRSIPVVAGALGVGGVAVAAVPARVAARPALWRRWRTWAAGAALFLGALCLGVIGAMVLAVVLGLIATGEYARLARLGRGERAVLGTAAVLLPPMAFLAYGVPAPRAFDLRFLAVLLVAGVLPAVLSGDSARGGERAARTVLGLVWIPVALSGLVVLHGTAVAVGVAVAFGEVCAWCGGRFLSRLGGGLARPLSAHAPDRTWAAVLAAGIGVASGLEVAGCFTVTLWAAVLGGCVVGGPLVSLLRREAGVEDTRTWLPGVGGLLDRTGSLLVALSLAMVVIL
ncbi:phosphatidate cytidylyltransferase [Streptomyces sp. ISL-11]|uniref:phosphatidate cytidylyltransferase n=1 Tax=Streptomyces sp. ISL-11 TaxID=2819174 RepID=UPI001BE82BD8|nr:phosphatidate cytidylyltransferase [Streptomyces sp. ISL-11]MBT2386337.1 phosphatidate cytidylyltransferase [Streptomyces sp. ISL-11]